MARFFLTTAIDYANGDPHLGHALEKQKQWEPSRQAHEQVVSRFPQSPWALDARYGMGWAHQNQNQPLGISMGALMSRMSAAASELVAALLVADDGAGTMIAEEFVFIVSRDVGVFPAFQRICPARWRKAGRFAIEWSRCSLRGTI